MAITHSPYPHSLFDTSFILISRYKLSLRLFFQFVPTPLGLWRLRLRRRLQERGSLGLRRLFLQRRGRLGLLQQFWNLLINRLFRLFRNFQREGLRAFRLLRLLRRQTCY
ncbi:hypothetical protein K501DRAFT_279794 [Backusella circina FSU 941]|nr:hypothetical protein K501DRAFT_279794 [Backusella circina FSU 941]